MDRSAAQSLRAQADALCEAYRRRTWWRFALVFFPVPFVLVLLRLEVEAWHYYIFGAAYVGFSALLYRLDSRDSAKCDEAVKAAEEAEHARATSSPPHSDGEVPASSRAEGSRGATAFRTMTPPSA